MTFAVSCGRDAIRWTGAMWVCLGDSKDEARESANTEIQKLLGIPWEVQPDRCYGLGTPQDCTESIQRFVDLGLTHLMFARLRQERYLEGERGYALGTPKDMIETIESYVEIGLTNFVIDPGWAPRDILAQVEVFAKEVIPHFR